MRSPRLQTVGLSVRETLTPSGGLAQYRDLITWLNGLPLSKRWETRYASSGGVTCTVTQGSAVVTGVSSAFTSYLGDIWMAVGASPGFTPTKFYKVEAVNSATELVLEHPWIEATAAGQAFVLFRPVRYGLIFEPGNYDYNITSTLQLTVPLCLSLNGMTRDAQIFLDSNVANQSLLWMMASSGELQVNGLSLANLAPSQASNGGHCFARLQATEAGIVNLDVSRCRLHAPYADSFVSQGAGTVTFRNNEGYVGYDGIGGIVAPDKMYAYGNIVRSSAPMDATHGKSFIAAIVNAKGNGKAAREVWIHDNIAQIENAGDGACVGVSFKVSSATGMPGALTGSRLVSSNNQITVGSDSSAAETDAVGFGAGIYAWGHSGLVAESHGDIITLTGSGTHRYGYKADISRLNIWRRPDALAVQKTNAGTIYDDGVAI